MTLTRRQFAASLGLGLATSLVNQAGLGSVLPAAHGSPSLLYPGEQVMDAAGFPTLVKFQKGRPDKPLVVFLPGTSFLARIAYGFPAGRPSDFLSYWLAEEGYSFLGASYPLDNPVYPRVYPAFNIRDWGRQAAAAAQHFIRLHGLNNRIFVIGWSMGGKVVESVAASARDQNLDLELFVALDALAPGPNLFPGNAQQLRLARNGMVDQAGSLMPWFVQMIAMENKINGHTILPETVLRTQFTGNPPLDLQGEILRFHDGRMVTEIGAAATDSGSFDYNSYPPMALIISNSPADYPNVLLCKSNWSLFMGQQLYRKHIYPNRQRVAALDPAKWKQLQDLFGSAMSELTMQIAGTHFLFLGEQGAHATATAIGDLHRKSDELNRKIAALIG